MHIMRLICVTVLLLSATTGHARPVPPLEGLEALRKGFLDTNDFTADISQEKRLSVMKRSMLMTGTVRFRKPDLFYMEINPTSGQPYAAAGTVSSSRPDPGEASTAGWYCRRIRV